ncbi:MAG: radical SAM protein [Lentisphaerae bacterium]|nr:radical SAM protein [Lentisphaerota bacterium]
MQHTLADYRSCRLCPRQCGCDRTAGQLGRCGESADCRVASAGPHFGEEPCFTGHRGSGTIFFSGCSCGCFFCQNHQISHGHQGRIMTPEELLEQALALARSGVHNLNFVTPDHFWPHLRRLAAELRNADVDIPFIWNCSGYCNADTLRQQLDVMDIFLPDFKFSDTSLAKRCIGDDSYPQLARQAMQMIVERVGFLRPWDVSGDICASRGLLVRHLVLPGEVANSLGVLKILYNDFGTDVPISLMSQYRPMPACAQRDFLNRQITMAEYREVCDYAEQLGFRKIFIQPKYGDPNFLPDFNRRKPFAGNP